MNERIRELAEQCWVDRKYGPAWFNQEKFAELIVRECIAECWYDATPKQISDNIKMKFGVE